MGIRGNILKWIANFLQHRTFRVAIGEHKSSIGRARRGVPQGSPLSPTLFNILMSDLTLPPTIQKIIYADDITITASHEDFDTAVRYMEQGITTLKEWTDQWDLHVNISKSKLMCFTNRKIRYIPQIAIGGQSLTFTTTHDILGLRFDAPRLTWTRHIENLRITIQKRLRIMKKLTSLRWGVSRKTLTKFYDIYIQPKINYGATIYSAASDTQLGKLQTLQNEAMRIATGCFKSTPIICLQALTAMLPLQQRRKLQEINHFTKILEHQDTRPLKQRIKADIGNTGPGK